MLWKVFFSLLLLFVVGCKSDPSKPTPSDSSPPVEEPSLEGKTTESEKGKEGSKPVVEVELSDVIPSYSRQSRLDFMTAFNSFIEFEGINSYTNVIVNLLLDLLFKDRTNDVAFINSKGLLSSENKKYAYTHVVKFNIKDKKEIKGLEKFAEFLKNLMTKNLSFPEKVFIPVMITFDKQASFDGNHALLFTFEKMSNGKIRMGAIDSKGWDNNNYTPIYFNILNEMAISLEAKLSKKVFTVMKMTQFDEYSCSIHLVDNIALLSQKTELFTEDDIPMRFDEDIKAVFEKHEVLFGRLKEDIYDNLVAATKGKGQNLRSTDLSPEFGPSQFEKFRFPTKDIGIISVPLH